MKEKNILSKQHNHYKMFILSFISLYTLILGSSHGFLRKENNATLMPSQTTLMPSLENNATDTIVVSSFSVANNCTEDSDCNYRGICTNINVCQCEDGYTTFPETHSTGCNYKQKSALAALLLQLFLGIFGAGYFYLGVVDLAVGELFLFWGGSIFICILGCVFVCIKNSNDTHYDEKVSVITNLFIFLITIGTFIWWIYSMVTIGNGTQLDGNGATLADL